MQYKVIETQDHTEPLGQWSVVAAFATEQLALAFADLHYETQVFTDGASEESGPSCVCTDCSDGFRPVDRMAFVVHVVADGVGQ